MIEQILPIVAIVVLFSSATPVRNNNEVLVYEDLDEIKREPLVVENLDDLDFDIDTNGKIVDYTMTNASDSQNSLDFEDDEENTLTEPTTTEMSLNIPCEYSACKKVEQALQNASNDFGGQFNKFVEAGKSIMEAKKQMLFALPKAVMTFFQSMFS